jgi:hypothetical protein
MAAASQSPNSDVSNVDGSVDFSGGVNSLKVTTIQSEQNPNGLARNELAWLTNGTVRDGGITPRGGWRFNKLVGTGSGTYQGGFLYQPIDGSDPYFLFLIGGRLFRANVDDNTFIDLFSTAYVQNAFQSPSITIKNLSIPPVGTIGDLTVAPDIQSIFGLPAFFAQPAIGSNIKFQTTVDPQGATGDIIQFYGSMTCTALAYSYDVNANNWVATTTLRADQANLLPSGQTVTGLAFGNPHGTPISGQLTNVSTWGHASFVAPNFGNTVVVQFTTPGDYRINPGIYILQDASFSYPVEFGAQVVTFNGTNTITNSSAIHSPGTFNDSGGHPITSICGKPVRNLNTLAPGTVINPTGIFNLNCTPLSTWQVPNALPPLSSFRQTQLALTRAATIPTGLFPNTPLAVGSIVNFLTYTASITNIHHATPFNFGSGLNKPFFVLGRCHPAPIHRHQ